MRTRILGQHPSSHHSHHSHPGVSARTTWTRRGREDDLAPGSSSAPSASSAPGPARPAPVMDSDGAPSFVWRWRLALALILIFIPGSALDGIAGATSTTAATTSSAPAELRRPIDDRTILRTQSTTPADPSTATATATASLVSRPTTAAAGGSMNVSAPTGTKGSFNPSETKEPTTPTTPLLPATASAASTAAAPRGGVSATMAGRWGTGAAANKAGSEGITDNSDDNGNGNRVGDTSNSRGSGGGSGSGIARDRQQRLLQTAKLLQGHEDDFAGSKQFVRQVAPELPTSATAEDGANNDLVADHELPTRAKLHTDHSDHAPVEPQTEATPGPEELPADATNGTAPGPGPTASPATAATTFTAATTTTSTTTTTTAQPALPHAVDGYQTITSQAGTHAYLPCNVKQLVKKPISWLRVRDGHILTVDQTTFIADQRFQSIYTPNPERWSLQIKYVQTKDAGSYECQVSTEPKTSAIVTLRIVEPRTELVGEETRHVKAGSPVRLRCVISQALEPPVFINWFYNQKQIYLHNRRGWRTEIERMELPPEVATTSTTSGTTTTTSEAVAAATTTTMMTMVTSAASSATATEKATATTTTAQSMSSLKSAGAAASRASLGAEHPSLSVSMSVPGVAVAVGVADRRATAAWTAAAAGVGGSFPTEATHRTTTATAADVRQITTASLIIAAVEKQDSGNYTCSPSNSAPRTVVLHVLNGEYSASAITSGGRRLLVSGRSRHPALWPWLGDPTLLTLLWIIRFLHSLAFARQTGRRTWARGPRRAAQAAPKAEAATPPAVAATALASASASSIPGEPAAEKT